MQEFEKKSRTQGRCELPIDPPKSRSRRVNFGDQLDWDWKVLLPFIASLDQVPEHLRPIYSHARFVELPPLPASVFSAETSGIYSVWSASGESPSPSNPFDQDRTKANRAAESPNEDSWQKLLYLSPSEPTDLMFLPEGYLYAADQILRDQSQPVLRRRLAQNIILQLIRIMVHPTELKAHVIVWLLSVGRQFERMQVLNLDPFVNQAQSARRGRSAKARLRNKRRGVDTETLKSTFLEVRNREPKYSRQDVLVEVAKREGLEVDTVRRKLTGFKARAKKTTTKKR